CRWCRRPAPGSRLRARPPRAIQPDRPSIPSHCRLPSARIVRLAARNVKNVRPVIRPLHVTTTTPSSQRLGGRVCLITGGASGIGLATARLFALEGATVAIIDLAEQLPDTDFEASLHRADVADEAAVAKVVGEIVGRFGRIDVLVNNAGISGVGDVLETSPELWDDVMRVNVRS